MASIQIDEARLREILEIAKRSDSVELKLTVPAGDLVTLSSRLGLDPIEAEVRQIIFFDTPDLVLDSHGVAVRARRIQGGAGDSAVKLRPVDPDRLPPKLREIAGFKVEVDVMPGGFVCSASMKGPSKARDIARAMTGDKAIKSLFSKEHRSFYKDHAPGGLKFKALAPLGPILTLKLKSHPKGFGHKLVTELWLYPDGSRILELSTRCPPRDVIQVATETKLFLRSKGVELTETQQTKTKAALKYFSSRLAARLSTDDQTTIDD